MKDDRVPDQRVLVYSTDGSMPVPGSARRALKPVARAMPDDGVVRITREHRRASVVTVVHGLTGAELAAAGKELKRLCGSGGTAKNGVVELQGDHRDKVVAYFTAQGRQAKRAGG
jgi:translation initiation factor 1